MGGVKCAVRHLQLRTVLVIFNVSLSVVLLLLLLTMIDKREYAEVVIESPVFFGDILLILCVSIGPIIIGGVFVSDIRAERQAWFLPMILVILAIGAGAASYYCLPSVREDRLLKNLHDVERAIEHLREDRDHFQNHKDYYQHRMAELQMFRAWFESQFEFIGNADHMKDKRAGRLPLFFGALGILFAGNAAWLFSRGRQNAIAMEISQQPGPPKQSL